MLVGFAAKLSNDLFCHASYGILSFWHHGFTLALKRSLMRMQNSAMHHNVNISLADTMAVNILNKTTAQSNVFWADDSIRLVSQPIPINHELFSGMRTESFSIPNVGLNGVVAYQGDINTLSGKCRIALWYSACAVRPESIGVGLANQA